MTVALLRAYSGFPAGAVVTLPAELEASLVAQGLALTSAAVPTSGAATNLGATDGFPQVLSGIAAVAIGASSVVISNPKFAANSKVFAQIQQAAADATLTSIVRTLAGAGTITITGNANATAATQVSYFAVV